MGNPNLDKQYIGGFLSIILALFTKIMDWKEHLKYIYFDLKNPISYSGPTKIYHHLKKEGKYKVGLSAIKQWLQDIDAYSLQRPQRYKIKTNKVISQGIDFLWDADLADGSSLSDENDDFKFVLVTIDDFSSICLGQTFEE
jgi:hypothetical protein